MTRLRTRQFQAMLAGLLLLVANATPAAAQKIAGGLDHTVMLRPDGTVWTWGSNWNGQLGDPLLMSHDTPWQVPGMSDIVAVAAGAGHTLALSSGGTVFAWGLNNSGQLGDGTITLRREPVQLGLTGIVAIAAGLYHSVALKNDGTVYTWGLNQTGQLGNNSTTNSNSPVQVGVAPATAIGAGNGYTLVVASDTTVWGWGQNSYGQLGDGTTTQRLLPVQMTGVANAVAIDGSNSSTFVLLTDGTVRSVGYNGTGTLGDGTQIHRTTTVAVTVLTDVTEVAAGDTHVLALKLDGTVWAWGSNSTGQLGLNDQTYRSTPTQIPGLAAVASVGVGDNQSFAITADTAPAGSNGVLWAWGFNYNRELGDGTAVLSLIPIAITAANFTARVATPTFSQAPGTFGGPINVVVSTVTAGAEIHYTTNGTDPTSSDSVVANGGTLVVDQNTTLKARAFKVDMPDSNVAAAVYQFSVAMPTLSPAGGSFTSPPTVSMSTTTPSSTIRYTADGSTPTGSSLIYTGPLSLSTSTTLKAIATRTGWISSAVRSGSYTLQYGTAQAPTASHGTGTYDGQVSVSLSGPSGATIRYSTNGTDPSAGSPIYTAALTFSVTTTLKAKAFHPDYNPSVTLTQVYTIRALAPVLSLTSGAYSPGATVAITHPEGAATVRMTITGADPVTSDVVVASGFSLAVGGFTLKARASKTGCVDSVVSAATYSLTEPLGQGAVAGGTGFTIVARPDGVLYGFGGNGTSQLGDGTTTTRTTPTLIQTLTGVTAVTAGASHALARTWDGRLYAWGSNGSGRLGDGTTTTRPRPVLLTGIMDVVAVAAGGNHTLALTGAGQVYAWGAGSSGQLGLGDTSSQSLPTLVSALSNVVAIAAGANHSLAVTTAGQVYAWGSNGGAQIGDGTTTTRTSPTLLSGISNVASVAAGTYHSLALTQAGAVYAWGYGANGQLGLGTTTQRATPVLLTGLNALALFSGSTFSAAIRNDGVLLAWGANNVGQLGDTTTTQRLSPTVVANVPASALVAAGDNHMIAMTGTGQAWTWGQGTSGQLGDGTTSRSTPLHAFTLAGTWGAAPSPVLSLAPGTYSNPQTLVVSHPMPSAVVRYTSDNSEPTEASAELPAGGTFPIEGTQALRFRAWASTLPPSRIVNATYTLQPLQPTISPAPGTYASGQTVTLSTATTGTTLHYTLDGSEPTESSSTYTAPFALATTSVVKVKAFRTDWTPSLTASAALTFNYGTLDSPVVSPGNGTYAPTQEIVLTAAAGATIAYTLDGSDPSGSSLVYNTPLTLPIGTTTLKSRAYRTDWAPSAVVSRTYQISTDTTPPTITAQVSPEPNQHGWHNGDVTVTFTCEDAESGIASCPGPVTVTWEGEAIAISREAVDTVGNRATATATVKVDLSAPYLTVYTPRPTDILPLGTTTAAIRGGAMDVMSGVDVVTCNGSAATLTGQTYACDVAVGAGTTTVQIVARDLVGLEATATATVVVGEIPAPTSLEITPTKMTVYSGEVRELHVIDQAGRRVPGGTWTVDQPAVAEVFEQDSRFHLRALAQGTATLTLTRDGLSDQTIVTVLSTGTEMPANAVFWELKGAAGDAPMRGTVLPALSPLMPADAEPPAYFFIDEGTARGGAALYRPAGKMTRISAITRDGRQVWDYSFDDGIPKQFAADNHGGLLILLSNDYGGSPSVPERVRRLDGATGTISWEYIAQDGSLTEFAVHPNGTVYLADEAYHRPGTDLVALNGLTGAVARYALPRGDTPYPPATGPIVQEDRSVVLIFGRESGGVYEYLTAGMSAEGTFSTSPISAATGIGLGDSRLLPDGHGGLLIANRYSPKVARFHPTTGVTAPIWLVPEGSWREGPFETEYVVGETTGGALIKDYDGATIRAGLITFDPLSPNAQLPQNVYPPDDVQLRFMLADTSMHVSGPGSGIFFPNDTQIAPGVWAGWAPGRATYNGAVDTAGGWSAPLGWVGRNAKEYPHVLNFIVPDVLVDLGGYSILADNYAKQLSDSSVTGGLDVLPTSRVRQHATVKNFVAALGTPMPALAFIGHAVLSENPQTCLTSATCQARGIVLNDKSLMKAPYVDGRDDGKPPSELAFTQQVPENETIQVKPKIVFFASCALGDIFRSMWSVKDNITTDRALIVPTTKGTDLYWASQAWIHILMKLSAGENVTVFQAVEEVNNEYLLNFPLKFQVIGGHGVTLR